MKRNEKANCGNCLYSHNIIGNQNTIVCMRYPPTLKVDKVKVWDTEISVNMVCGQHPDFFERDSSDLDAEIKRMNLLAAYMREQNTDGRCKLCGKWSGEDEYCASCYFE